MPLSPKLPSLIAHWRRTRGPQGQDGGPQPACFHSGETCLHQAAALGQRTICHYIVEAGASLMKTDQQVSSRAGHSRGHRAALSPAPALVNRSHGEGLPFRTGSCSLINTVWILRNLSPPCGAWGGGGWRAHDCLSFEAFPLLTGNLEGRSPALSQGPRSDGCCPPPCPRVTLPGSGRRRPRTRSWPHTWRTGSTTRWSSGRTRRRLCSRETRGHRRGSPPSPPHCHIPVG